jgi:hypothetical protein
MAWVVAVACSRWRRVLRTRRSLVRAAVQVRLAQCLAAVVSVVWVVRGA